jgi:hypothetical protein
MSNSEGMLTKKQVTIFLLIELSILVFFAAGIVWIFYYVGFLGNGGPDVVLAVVPYCFLPYLMLICIYVGYFMARFARGRRKFAWLWGIIGFVLTAFLAIGLPIMLGPIFPYQSPAIFAFLAPILSTVLLIALVSFPKSPQNVGG